MYSMLNNIIIGANGFLGSFLKSKIENSINVISDTDSRKGLLYHDFFKEIQNYKNSIIYICATPSNNEKIINDLKLNTNPNNTYILFSSAVVYDGINKDIYNEDDYISKSETEIDNYVNQTIQNEIEFNKLNGRKIIIRLGTLYGFSPYLNATRGINRMIYYILINNQIIINNPSLKKSFTSLNDLYHAINIILNNKRENEIYNISSFDTTIQELGEYISKKYEVEIKYDIVNKKEYSFKLDTTKCKTLGWTPKSTLETIETDITNNFSLIQEVKYSLSKDNDIIIWKRKHQCRVCESYNLKTVLNLNNQPPPNRLSDLFWKFINFPLELNVCNNCYNSQLSGVMNPIIMYKNYSYLSGTAITMRNYFDSFVEKYVDKNKKKVLDIACNDGALLDSFKKYNFETYGVDPATNIVKNIKNHKIYEGFFEDELVNTMDTDFDIVTAFNVFAHVDNIYNFLDNINKITKEDCDVFIQTSQCDMIINNEFDTIYHEHLSFFTIKSILEMEKHTIFKLKEVYIVGVHGNSYLFLFKKNVKNTSNTVTERYNYENSFKLYENNTYITYANNIYNWRNNFINFLRDKKRIIGVGASAKGITILNFLKSNNLNVECIIDENPLKVNKTINSVNIKINPFSYIKEDSPDPSALCDPVPSTDSGADPYPVPSPDSNIVLSTVSSTEPGADSYPVPESITFILFAWNFKDELIEKIKKINNNKNEFVNLFPLEVIL
jgi:2-polyprenyl-3-methyl-5-hydroxy-6-metoxy-1,4-benzoquinol methylase/dTDP-4-dehydrorhamnose reductase